MFVGVECALLVGTLLAGDGSPCGVRCEPVDNKFGAALKPSSLAAASTNPLVFVHKAVVSLRAIFDA